ncbi:heavy metal translocating P-type ATPase metal-binding domain-containing protein [Panacibacter sp. DH6]|uniref:Heavy metal translocating P-type ATPase metal-binding domain-containing protein n=1 Tax=Panacibacter microcysteis TaxID=2793269 RepID=A0A931MCH8_9BACT|nr:heavy metal translocating P-type ATPase metal-binding domain-containing protein [Panacibacter microcysteis]MBG9378126.1 heavy metal translocating P-type ATPase metal-binding domain-containing protein [Panacibacter microcysteis]
MDQQTIQQQTACFHCGEQCDKEPVIAHGKSFCCEGCKMVYEILNDSGLCDYYTISKNPGASRRVAVRKDKFGFLNDEKIMQSLISFRDATQTHVTLYLPQMHCSSCLWLLENLHRLQPAILSSKVNFTRKEATVVFDHRRVTLKDVADLLTSIGYEPYISFNDMKKTKPVINKSKIYKLGVAGFCFANIMLLSFPEYLGINAAEENLVQTFRWLNVLLSLPVFFFSASEFYTSAWKSLKHKFLNIDAPIVLAVWVTFGRSLYEVISGTGSGYFDSMTGIVFFMLIGRILQDKTYEQLSFERDYTSYFPVAVTKIFNGKESTVSLPDIKLNDTLLIHHEELIPADGILTRGRAYIDYSFVTGESMPVRKEMGEIVYAGGKQTGSNIEILVIKEVAQSYLTKLWNREEFQKDKAGTQLSFVHLLSRYFTWIVFAVASVSALYWSVIDPVKIWPSVTAVLIIACPCALLLSNTFTNGNILRILGRNKFYLRNAQIIEEIGKIDQVVFDKTGTLTTGAGSDIIFIGEPLSLKQKKMVAALASQSTHPASKAIAVLLGGGSKCKIEDFSEIPGYGVEALVDGTAVVIGSQRLVSGKTQQDEKTSVYVAIDHKVSGRFVFKNHYRNNIGELIDSLKDHYGLAVLSGDNDSEAATLANMFGEHAQLYFQQKPEDKLQRIKQLQQQGKKVMMLGDGLNDAGALKQADVGIAVSDASNNFTPASDAIVDAAALPKLQQFIKLCIINKRIVLSSFIVSILYNIVGIFFAVQGTLSPMIAAILMPASSLSILLITFGSSSFVAWKMKLLK